MLEKLIAIEDLSESSSSDERFSTLNAPKKSVLVFFWQRFNVFVLNCFKHHLLCADFHEKSDWWKQMEMKWRESHTRPVCRDGKFRSLVAYLWWCRVGPHVTSRDLDNGSVTWSHMYPFRMLTLSSISAHISLHSIEENVRLMDLLTSLAAVRTRLGGIHMKSDGRLCWFMKSHICGHGANENPSDSYCSTGSLSAPSMLWRWARFIALANWIDTTNYLFAWRHLASWFFTSQQFIKSRKNAVYK